VNIQLTFLDEIRQLHAEIISSARTTLEKAIRIGELLVGQKATLKHGQWLPWVKENLPFEHATASRYMGVYARRDEISHNEKFGLTEAYRLLAAPAELAEPELLEELDSGPPSILDKIVAAEMAAEYSGEDPTEEIKHLVAQLPSAPSDKPHVSHNSGENEWYTPPKFIEAARLTMGGIDLDPASCALANKTVKAKTFYDKAANGLEKKWSGKVWMNPPYSHPEIGEFSEKIASEFDSGNVEEACVLVNNATDTAWFQSMMERAAGACFIKGRVKYLDKTGIPANTPLQGQAILYFGKRVSRFAKHFRQFGFILLKA
jgi:phage N-6-adenine-methyltransferase